MLLASGALFGFPVRPEPSPGTATARSATAAGTMDFHAGASFSSRSADFPAQDRSLEENVFSRLRLSVPDGLQAAAELELILESRRSAEPTSPAPGTEESGRQRVYLSGRWRSRWLDLAAGRRYQPGPRHNFLGQPGLFAALPGLPNGRRTGALFVHCPGLPWSPGLFAIEGAAGAGLYLTDPGQNYLLAYHPGSAAGVFAGRSEAGRLGWAWDIVRNERTTEGFARLRLEPAAVYDDESQAGIGDDFEFLLEGERREAWDYKDFAAGELFPEREGKSGLAYGGLGYADLLGLEIAGQDIGQDGLRLARFSAGLPAGERWPGLGLDAGYYRRRTYRAESAEEYRDRALGLFVHFRRRASFARLRAEGRASGLVTGEIAAGLRAGDYRFEMSAVFRSPLPKRSFLAEATTPADKAEASPAQVAAEDAAEAAESYVPAADLPAVYLEDRVRRSLRPADNRVDRAFLFQKVEPDQDSGARFHRDESGVVRLRLRGPALYVLIQSRISAGRPRLFSRIQFETTF